MTVSYAYIGAPTFIDVVETRLKACGFSRVQDVHAASLALTFCTSQSALEEAYFGDEGLITVMRKGTTLVDLSATTPSFARELNAMATVSELAMVEAPLVVRSLVKEDVFARENLFASIASESEVPPEARVLLDAIFGEIADVGAPGAAQLLRSRNTIALATSLVAHAEAEALCGATQLNLGIAATGTPTSCDVGDVGDFGCTSAVAGDEISCAIRERRFTSAYTTEMLLGELSAALTSADDAQLIMPQVEAAMHLFELLAVIGGSDLAPTALVLVYSEEEEGARAGLDWTRAEKVYGDVAHGGDDDAWDADDDDYDRNDYDELRTYEDYEGFDFSSN